MTKISIERSKKFNNIISKQPNWIIRNGIGILFILFLILISLAYTIKIPIDKNNDGIIDDKISIVNRITNRK